MSSVFLSLKLPFLDCIHLSMIVLCSSLHLSLFRLSLSVLLSTLLGLLVKSYGCLPVLFKGSSG